MSKEQTDQHGPFQTQVKGSDTRNVKEEHLWKRFTPGNKQISDSACSVLMKNLRKQFPLFYEKFTSIFYLFCSDLKVHRKSWALELKALWGRLLSKESLLKVGRNEKELSRIGKDIFWKHKNVIFNIDIYIRCGVEERRKSARRWENRRRDSGSCSWHMEGKTTHHPKRRGSP